MVECHAQGKGDVACALVVRNCVCAHLVTRLACPRMYAVSGRSRVMIRSGRLCH